MSDRLQHQIPVFNSSVTHHTVGQDSILHSDRDNNDFIATHLWLQDPGASMRAESWTVLSFTLVVMYTFFRKESPRSHVSPFLIVPAERDETQLPRESLVIGWNMRSRTSILKVFVRSSRENETFRNERRETYWNATFPNVMVTTCSMVHGIENMPLPMLLKRLSMFSEEGWS